MPISKPVLDRPCDPTLFEGKLYKRKVPSLNPWTYPEHPYTWECPTDEKNNSA